ncbi:MAG: hypothetical protein LBB75_00835 [Oscillospiraceae bacterium]|jgi:hypothetical protein|nr:hypothetical protein [Oscillospiraceae bacterium]
MPEYDPVPEQTEPHPYQKLGGWLLLFTIIPLITFPYGLFTQVKDLSHFSYAQDAVSILYLLIKAIYFFNLGFALTGSAMVIRRKPRFLRVRQINMLFMALSFILTCVKNVVTADETTALMAIAMLMTSIFVVPFETYLFMLYYFRSIRVRTYMGSDEYLRRAFFSKKFKGPEPAAPDAA